MANINIEKFINDLSPELQEKARECKSAEELNTFIAENDIELPEDALEMVAGGCGTAPKKEVWICNICNSTMSDNDSDGKSWWGGSNYPTVYAPREGPFNIDGAMVKYCPTCKKWYEYCNNYMRKEMR